MEASDTGIWSNAIQALTMYMANIFPTVKRLHHTIRLSPWNETTLMRELNDRNDLKDNDAFLNEYIMNPQYDSRGCIIFQVKFVSSFDFNRLRTQGDQQPGLKEQREQHFGFLRRSKIWINIIGIRHTKNICLPTTIRHHALQRRR